MLFLFDTNAISDLMSDNAELIVRAEAIVIE